MLPPQATAQSAAHVADPMQQQQWPIEQQPPEAAAATEKQLQLAEEAIYQLAIMQLPGYMP